MAGISPRSLSNFGWWSSGQVTYFRERGPGSIPGVPRVEEIVRFLQNETSARLESRTLRSEEGALPTAPASKYSWTPADT